MFPLGCTKPQHRVPFLGLFISWLIAFSGSCLLGAVPSAFKDSPSAASRRDMVSSISSNWDSGFKESSGSSFTVRKSVASTVSYNPDSHSISNFNNQRGDTAKHVNLGLDRSNQSKINSPDREHLSVMCSVPKVLLSGSEKVSPVNAVDSAGLSDVTLEKVLKSIAITRFQLTQMDRLYTPGISRSFFRTRDELIAKLKKLIFLKQRYEKESQCLHVIE